MLAAILLMLQVAGLETMATCRVPDDSQQRSFSLVVAIAGGSRLLRARTLDQPSVELPIGAAHVNLAPLSVW